MKIRSFRGNVIDSSARDDALLMKVHLITTGHTCTSDELYPLLAAFLPNSMVVGSPPAVGTVIRAKFTQVAQSLDRIILSQKQTKFGWALKNLTLGQVVEVPYTSAVFSNLFKKNEYFHPENMFLDYENKCFSGLLN